MGKTFHLLSTDPVTRRRLQQAHELRNAYLRARSLGCSGVASPGSHVRAQTPARLIRLRTLKVTQGRADERLHQ
jgi:hypothetical protein